MSETSDLIEELTKLTPEEIYGYYLTEDEIEEMAKRDAEFERDRAYDALMYREAA